MPGWDELLAHLAEMPQENGTGSLREAASYLVEILRVAGVKAQRAAFIAHPYEILRTTGAIASIHLGSNPRKIASENSLQSTISDNHQIYREFK